MPTDSTGAPVRQVVVTTTSAEEAAIDRLPGVHDELDAIDAEQVDAENNAAEVRSAFINGSDEAVTLEDVEAAERAAATAKLTTARRKAKVRAEAKAAWAERVDRLVAEHGSALEGSTDAITTAKTAVVDAVADLIRATNAHNQRVHSARRDLLSAGPVPLPEGVDVSPGVTPMVTIDGTTHRDVELINRAKTVGVIPSAIDEAQARVRSEA